MLIYGTGGHARVVFECFYSQDIPIDGFVEDYKKIDTFLGKPVLKSPPKEHVLVVAIGDNAIRQRLVKSLGNTFKTATHKTATVSQYAEIGDGCMIIQKAVVQNGVTVGNHVIINTAAVVDHDCILNDYVHIAPNSTLCEGVHVKTGALVGAGAVVLPRVSIGAWSKIGAGSVVTKDVADGSVVVGNPARVLR